MKKFILLSSIVVLFNTSCKKEEIIYGCTDSNAENYSNKATDDDGSCYFLETIDPVDPAANVVSGQGTITNWLWDDPHYFGYLNYEAITQDIIDNGAVFVYWMSGSGHIQLPYTYYPTDTYSRSYQVFASPGQIRIRVTDSDLDQPGNPGSMTFKVVVIESSNLPEIDFNDYDEVSKYYELDNN